MSCLPKYGMPDGVAALINALAVLFPPKEKTCLNFNRSTHLRQNSAAQLSPTRGTAVTPSGGNRMNMFESEFIATMKGALAQAAFEVHPDPSTEALMAERILRSAANGVRSQEELKAVATDAARTRSA